MKKLLRTIQVELPWLQETKAGIIRAVRNALSIPFERDFRALPLFPDVPDRLFVDVGANRGQSTDAILLAFRDAQIRLFEPNPVLAERLRQMFADRPRIQVEACGLGEVESSQPLFVPTYKNWVFDGLASFDADSARTWLGGRVYAYRPNRLRLQQMPCEVRRLDDFGLAPFFIKLDVQGFEYRALLGAKATLQAHQPVLLVEAPDAQLGAYLDGLGYTAYAFDGRKFLEGSFGDINTFFMTSSKAAQVARHIVSKQRGAAS